MCAVHDRDKEEPRLCTWSKRLASASELILSASGLVPGGGASAAMRSASSLIISASSLRFPIFPLPLLPPPLPCGAMTQSVLPSFT